MSLVPPPVFLVLHRAIQSQEKLCNCSNMKTSIIVPPNLNSCNGSFSQYTTAAISIFRDNALIISSFQYSLHWHPPWTLLSKASVTAPRLTRPLRSHCLSQRHYLCDHCSLGPNHSIEEYTPTTFVPCITPTLQLKSRPITNESYTRRLGSQSVLIVSHTDPSYSNILHYKRVTIKRLTSRIGHLFRSYPQSGLKLRPLPLDQRRNADHSDQVSLLCKHCKTKHSWNPGIKVASINLADNFNCPSHW